MEYEYLQALTDNGISYEQLPKDLKGKINYLKQLSKKAETDPDKVKDTKAMDAIIADEIQNFAEKDLEDNEEDTPNPNNNMKTKEQEALEARAKACGLSETASEVEVAAKEAEIAQNAEKTKALTARAKKVGLADDASEADIIAKETELANQDKDKTAKADALKVRAKAAGLAEDASEADIIAAEKKKEKPAPTKQDEDILDELM